MGSVWGEKLKISVFGESHGDYIGIVIDNFPHGVKIDHDFIGSQMKRRAPGDKSGLTTSRTEEDAPEIYSGVLNGFTSGSPICAVIKNTNRRSEDYQHILRKPRPSHADLTAHKKYGGFEDGRGGGHFSGRLTAPIVFAGALCSLFLRRYEINVYSHIKNIGTVYDDKVDYTEIPDEIFTGLKNDRLPFINKIKQKEAAELIEKYKKEGNSIGGAIECIIKTIPHSLGSPIFSSVESSLASMLFSIPGVKAVEFGEGVNFSNLDAKNANDEYYFNDVGEIKTRTNNNGGILGGITTGMPIVFTATLKPTPSIYSIQNTVDLIDGCNTKLQIEGRHDPCIAVRAVPVVESAAVIALTDIILSDGNQ